MFYLEMEKETGFEYQENHIECHVGGYEWNYLMRHRYGINHQNQYAEQHLCHLGHQIDRHHLLRIHPIAITEHEYVKQPEEIEEDGDGGIPRKIILWQQRMKQQRSSPTQHHHQNGE